MSERNPNVAQMSEAKRSGLRNNSLAFRLYSIFSLPKIWARFIFTQQLKSNFRGSWLASGQRGFKFGSFKIKLLLFCFLRGWSVFLSNLLLPMNDFSAPIFTGTNFEKSSWGKSLQGQKVIVTTQTTHLVSLSGLWSRHREIISWSHNLVFQQSFLETQ